MVVFPSALCNSLFLPLFFYFSHFFPAIVIKLCESVECEFFFYVITLGNIKINISLFFNIVVVYFEGFNIK